jgi:hypothetical protein
MNTGSRLRKRLQSKGISQKPFLTNNHADDQYKKNWPCCNHSVYYSHVLSCAVGFSIRAWGITFPDRPYCCLVSLIVCLIPRQPPTPSSIPTSLKQRSTSSARPLQLYEATHRHRCQCPFDLFELVFLFSRGSPYVG